MKTTRLLLMTSLLTMSIFTMVIYSSCRDACRGVTCINGGACSKGYCLCPSGYTGAHCENLATTEMFYQNNTFTTIYLTINGSAATIAPGQSVYYTGQAGSPAKGSAYTYGETATGGQIGEYISWSLDDYFPISTNSQTTDFNVSPDYFYLRIQNYSPYDISRVYVNYGTTAETRDDIVINNDHLVYGIGYYKAFSNTNIYLTSGTHYWSYTPTIPYENNAQYQFVTY